MCRSGKRSLHIYASQRGHAYIEPAGRSFVASATNSNVSIQAVLPAIHRSTCNNIFSLFLIAIRAAVSAEHTYKICVVQANLFSHPLVVQPLSTSVTCRRIYLDYPLTRPSLLPPRPRQPDTPRPHSSGRRCAFLMPNLTTISPFG